MSTFEAAKWIWYQKERAIDDYGEFYGMLDYRGGRVVCRISVDSDYALYINGAFVASNQYGDFPHYKIYDEIDVTPYLTVGANRVGILAWHFGVGSQKYYSSNAGLIFEFARGETVLLQSDERISARKSRSYACGRAKNVSFQLGMTFLCDLRLEDGWKKGELSGFRSAVLVEKERKFFVRPNEKLRYGKVVEPSSTTVKHGGRTVLVDLGKETVGLATLKLYSPAAQRITVCFGERTINDNVSRYIGGNDYSFEIIVKEGENEFFNPFLRLGCRYLQLCAEEPVKVEKLSLIPTYYPLIEAEKPELTEKDAAIYDLCVNTLKLCAFEHYVDCPFREQGLYAFDSMNQMLAGYYAFGGRDYFEYAKSNLSLFAQDRREDKLLAITAPSDTKLLIPSYSLHYVIAVFEYLQYSKDKRLDSSIFQKVTDIIGVFSKRIEEGLVRNFRGESYWNFYDWSEGADYVKVDADVHLNCLYVLAEEAYRGVCGILGVTPSENLRAEEVRKAIFAEFFDAERGLFFVSREKKTYTQLGNSLAILAGVVDKERAFGILEKIIDGETAESSLSTKRFFYDAMLSIDGKKYREYVLDDIRKNYGYMLACGATSTWETIEGAEAFGGSGSLCHGWSAIPIYYFNILKEGE